MASPFLCWLIGHYPEGSILSQANPGDTHPWTGSLGGRFSSRRAIDRLFGVKYNGERGVFSGPEFFEMPNRFTFAAIIFGIAIGAGFSSILADEPPSINPFGQSNPEPDDAVRGVVTLSDGSTHPGLIYLTRDKRLQIYDQELQRQREIPLQAVKKIECTVQREWLEKEWRFKEGANDEKIYTGRSYPARTYLYTITLKDGRKITGALSALIYVQPKPNDADKLQTSAEPERFLLNKRDKGEVGQGLRSLVYVKRVEMTNDKR
jgi:hypothetical protein